MSRIGNFRDHAKDASSRPRRGIVIVLTCVMLVVLLGLVAFGVDIGTIGLEKAKLQNACDAAALAAAQAIQDEIAQISQTLNPEGDIAAQVAAINAAAVAEARDIAVQVAQLNGVYLDPEQDVQFGSKTSAGVVSYGSPPYNLVKITARRTNEDLDAPDGQLKLSFAPAMGFDSAVLTASAGAYVQSRDIVLVLDYSGSMNDDSEFLSMSSSLLGKAAVEQNLDDMYKALADSNVKFSDKPTKSKFAPVTSLGDSAFGDVKYGEGTYVSDQIAAVYALTEKYKTSGMTRSQLRDKINAKSTSTISSDLNGSNTTESDVVSGGGMFSKTDAEWLRQNITSTRLSTALGKLTTDEVAVGIAKNLGVLETSGGEPVTPWPQEGFNIDQDGELTTAKGYPTTTESQRSWRDYVKWVRSNGDVGDYGYRNKFGTRTMVGYMLNSKTSKTQSEDLHRAPGYPFHAMKEGTTAFLEFLEGLDFGDRVGVVSYAGTTNGDTYDNRMTARFETYMPGDVNEPRMTDDYDELNNIQIERQAAEYSNYTGIGYGVKKAREMHARAGRPDARKVILVLTDGNANRSSEYNGLPQGWNWADHTDFNGDGSADFTTSDQHKQFAFVEAMSPVVIPESGSSVNPMIHTMAVGAGADRELMESMAKAGGGLYIDVPGGSTVSEMQEQMLRAFAEIASSVPSAQLLYDGDY